jgi:LysR family glycine cleavage system transcriptional activator
LRALEVAVRHSSFTKAAETLHVTPSAISHQIKLLEELWGVELFERKGQRLTATLAGQELANITRDFFDRMGQALDGLHVGSSREVLRVDTLQSFAVKWLTPRLGDFHALHEEIDVWISTHDQLVDFADNDVDVAIRLGDGHFAPGLDSVLLLQEEVFPVCTPEYLARVGRPLSPRTLLSYPLLLRLGELYHTNWEEWFAAAGIPGVKLSEGPRFPDTNMALEAAMKGLGVALARTAHVVDDLAAGRLVRLFDVRCPSNVAYYLVYPMGHQDRPAVKAFREWITSEMRPMNPKSEALSAGRFHQPSA